MEKTCLLRVKVTRVTGVGIMANSKMENLFRLKLGDFIKQGQM
jgi:hypothetical protein